VGSAKGALGLKHAEERTSKSGILAVVWAKKTLRRSRAETKEQNAFKRLQTQNFQPIASRRRRLFEYQLQECRVAAQMPQDLYGNAEASKSLGFSQSWLPAARLHHAHFEKRAPGDIQVLSNYRHTLHSLCTIFCVRIRIAALWQSDGDERERRLMMSRWMKNVCLTCQMSKGRARRLDASTSIRFACSEMPKMR